MPDAEHLDPAQVRERAKGGVGLLLGRGVLVQTLGVGANIALARLLVPRDFGLVALGAVLVLVGGALADGGFGATLIRRPAAPTRAELAAVNALQLYVTVALAAAVALAALPFGRSGLVVAAMVVSLPIAILRSPSLITLERRLEYRPIATADLCEAISYYAWAVGAVALGAGVWGMATAVVVRAAVGTTVVAALGPVGLVAPRWSWALLRPLFGFGAKFQAVIGTTLVRDQGLNVGIAAIAGVGTLGIWNLTYRVAQVPMLLGASAGRIWYPTTARLMAAGEDPRGAIERAVAALAVAIGAVLVAIVGFAPALPALVGHRWHAVPPTLVCTSAALMIGWPVAVVAQGYLFAADAAGTVLTSIVAHTVTYLALAFALLPLVGAPAAGIGWIGAGLVHLAIMGRATARRSGAALFRRAAPPTALAFAAGACGWAVGTAGSRSVVDGVLGAAAGELVLGAGLALLMRPLLRATLALVRGVARGVVRRPLEPELGPVARLGADPPKVAG